MRQAALLALQVLCRLRGLLPPRTVTDGLFQEWQWLAAMAQLGRVRADLDALEGIRETLQKAWLVAAEDLHDAIEALSHEQHDLAGRFIEFAE